MNYQPCIAAMRWFRENIHFSKDYTDIPRQLLEHAENPNMLKSIVTYAKQADVGIEDMSFEIKNEEISTSDPLPDNLPEAYDNGFETILSSLERFFRICGNES